MNENAEQKKIVEKEKKQIQEAAQAQMLNEKEKESGFFAKIQPIIEFFGVLIALGVLIIMCINTCQTKQALKKTDEALARTDSTLLYIRREYRFKRPYINILPKDSIIVVAWHTVTINNIPDSIRINGTLIFENKSEYPAAKVFYRTACAPIGSDRQLSIVINRFLDTIPQYFHLAPSEKDDNHDFELVVKKAIAEKYALYVFAQYSFENRTFFYIIYTIVKKDHSINIMKEIDIEITNLKRAQVVDSLVKLVIME